MQVVQFVVHSKGQEKRQNLGVAIIWQLRTRFSERVRREGHRADPGEFQSQRNFYPLYREQGWEERKELRQAHSDDIFLYPTNVYSLSLTSHYPQYWQDIGEQYRQKSLS